MRNQPNFEILKEPRGFIKLVEIGIAIFAFATTAGYYSEFKVTSSLKNATLCNDTKPPPDPIYEVLAKFEYPFNDDSYYISDYGNKCHMNLTGGVHEEGIKTKYKTESQFFVFTGVTTFLYCLVAIAYYVLFENQEESMYATDVGKFSFVVIDFVISVILVIFWFISSVAWASGLPGLKDATDPDKYIASSPYCVTGSFSCSVKSDPNYATLKVSIILGFLNLFVWLGNLWFLFKETPWHNPRQGILHDDSVQ